MKKKKLWKSKVEKNMGQMSIEMFLQQYIGLKQMKFTGQNLIGLCPFHDDQNRSFGLNIDYPHKWGCMIPDCKKGSSLTTLVMYHTQCSYEKAEEIIEQYMGYIKSISESTLDLQYYDEEEEYFIDEELLVEYSCGFVKHPYLIDRGLTEETIEELQLGFDRDRQRVVFPIFNEDNRLINFVGRTINKDVQPKYYIYEDVDRKTFMYGLDLLPDQCDYIVLYEGTMELAYSHQIGIPNCISLLGALITKKHIEILLRYTDTIVFFLDNDRAGKATVQKGVEFTKELGGRAKVVRHLTKDKDIKKDLLDYYSPRIPKVMIQLALRQLVPVYETIDQ